MRKLNLKIGTNVFYKNEAYTIQHLVNFHTVTIQSIHDKNIVHTVHTTNLSAKENTVTYDIEQFSDEEWQEAKKRYQIIKGLVCRQKTRQEVMNCAEKHNIGTTTLYIWIKQYENTEQISALVSKSKLRGKKGSRLNPVVEKIIDEVIEELYLTKQRTSFTKIYRHIKKGCLNSKLKVPHENTVRNRIYAIDPKLAMKKREGYKLAHRMYSSFEGKFPDGKFPLDVVQIDHTPLDIQLVDSTYGKPQGRPYLTLAIDVYSRMITGFYLSYQAPGYFSVSQCLLHSFLSKEDFLQKHQVDGEWNIYGIPHVIHVDNGQDLVSKDMQKVCEDLHITLMKRPVGNPQFGAHVERVFGTISKEVHNLKGSTFRNVQAKGDYDSLKQATFTLEKLTQWLTHYIINIYHKKIHYGLDMSPEEKYYQGIFGDDENPGTGELPSLLLNKESIEIMLMETHYRTVQKSGITLDGITYFSDLLRHWINKKDKQGKKIKLKIKRDPMNIKKIYFWDLEIKEYFEIYTRNIAAPNMTLWDMRDAKRYLKDKHISNYSEADIFKAYDMLEQIEQEASHEIKKKNLRKNKTPTLRKKETTKISTVTSSKEILPHQDLFKDIEIFNVYKHTTPGDNYDV